MNEVGNMVCDYKNIYEYQKANFSRIGLWLDKDLKEKVKKKAKEEEVSMSEYISSVLRKSL